MLEQLTRKAWLKIAAAVASIAVMMIVVAVVVGGDDRTDEVAAGTSVTEPAIEPSSPTTGDTTEPGDGATTAPGDGAGTAPFGGATTSATPPTSECDEPLVGGDVFGRRDLDADGVDELFVKTGSGASTDIIGVFRVQGCEAVQVTMDGYPAEFPVGAAVLHIDGLQASSDTLVVYSGTSADGQAFDVTWRRLRLDGSSLTVIGSNSSTAQLGDDLSRLASTFSA